MERLARRHPARAAARRARLTSARDARTLCENVVDTLVELHARRLRRRPAWRRWARAGLRRGARSRAGRALPRRRAPGTCRASERRDGWLRRSAAGRRRRCLIHNDCRFDNLVLDPTAPTRDHRRARLGDGHPRRPADGPRHVAWPTGCEADDDPPCARCAASRRTCPACSTRERGRGALPRADRPPAPTTGPSTRSSGCSGSP